MHTMMYKRLKEFNKLDSNFKKANFYIFHPSYEAKNQLVDTFNECLIVVTLNVIEASLHPVTTRMHFV